MASDESGAPCDQNRRVLGKCDVHKKEAEPRPCRRIGL
jgi:hypothetical protein